MQNSASTELRLDPKISKKQAGLPGHACGEGATPTLSAPFGAAVDLWWPDPGSLQKLGEP